MSCFLVEFWRGCPKNINQHKCPHLKGELMDFYHQLQQNTSEESKDERQLNDEGT